MENDTEVSQNIYPKLGKKYWPYAKLKYLAIFGSPHSLYLFLNMSEKASHKVSKCDKNAIGVMSPKARVVAKLFCIIL